jgi:chemotaxis protein histidine kinase CheA
MSEFTHSERQSPTSRLVSPVQRVQATPRSARAESSLLAQRQPLGNQAAQRFAQFCPLGLPSPSVCPFGGICHACPVQAKPTEGGPLTVNEPGDKYEQEADRVAEQVMSMPEPRVQRQEEEPEEEEEEPIQAKPLAKQITPLIQRQPEEEEEEEPEPSEPEEEEEEPEEEEVPEEEEEEEPIQTKLAEGTQIQRQEEEPEEEEVPEEEEEEEELVQAKPLVEQITPVIQRQVEPEEEEEEEEEPIQTKLAEGTQIQRQEEEPEEEEEEPIQAKPLAEQITPLVQRQVEPEEEGEEKEPVQTKLAEDAQIQRQEEEEKEEGEELIQTKQSNKQAPQVDSNLATQIRSLKSGGQSLPRSERDFFEPKFGCDFSQVRVHADPQAAAVSHALNAQAFTMGRDVVFGSGRYAPGTAAGQRLLAHELTHTIQQRGTTRFLQRTVDAKVNCDFQPNPKDAEVCLVHLHADEVNALEAAKNIRKRYCANLVNVNNRQGGKRLEKRLVKVSLSGGHYCWADPNRIFSDEKVTQDCALSGCNREDKRKAAKELHERKSFRSDLIGAINQCRGGQGSDKLDTSAGLLPIIALHNTKYLSIKEYTKKSKRWAVATAAEIKAMAKKERVAVPSSIQNPMGPASMSARKRRSIEHYRNFFLTTKVRDFLQLGRAGYNVVLQSPKVGPKSPKRRSRSRKKCTGDDGSLSVALKSARYINIEVGGKKRSDIIIDFNTKMAEAAFRSFSRPRYAKGKGWLGFGLAGSGIKKGKSSLDGVDWVHFINLDLDWHTIQVVPPVLLSANEFSVPPGETVSVGTLVQTRALAGRIIDNPGPRQTVHDLWVGGKVSSTREASMRKGIRIVAEAYKRKNTKLVNQAYTPKIPFFFSPNRKLSGAKNKRQASKLMPKLIKKKIKCTKDDKTRKCWGMPGLGKKLEHFPEGEFLVWWGPVYTCNVFVFDVLYKANFKLPLRKDNDHYYKQTQMYALSGVLKEHFYEIKNDDNVRPGDIWVTPKHTEIVTSTIENGRYWAIGAGRAEDKPVVETYCRRGGEKFLRVK